MSRLAIPRGLSQMQAATLCRLAQVYLPEGELRDAAKAVLPATKPADRGSIDQSLEEFAKTGMVCRFRRWLKPDRWALTEEGCRVVAELILWWDRRGGETDE